MKTILSIYKDGQLQASADITMHRVVSVGRHKYNPIQLIDTVISRFHAAFFYEEDDRYFLQDLGSQNGLLVNGERRDFGPVSLGDKIDIGDFTLVLQRQHKKSKSKAHKIAINEDIYDNSAATVFSPVPIRAQKFDRSDLDADALFILYRISHLANGSAELTESLQLIVDELYNTFKPDRVLIAALENSGEGLNCLAKAPGEDTETRMSRTMLTKLLEKGKVLITADALTDENFRLDGKTAKSVLQLKMKSVVCVPLKWRGEIRGILYMDCFSSKVLCRDKDVQLFGLMGEELSALIGRDSLYKAVVDEKAALEEKLEMKEMVIGNTPAIREILHKAGNVLDTDITVLITGETGTGKGNLARYIHKSSCRRDKPFIKINCSSIPENLLESELFGHEKGSFTGAEKRTGKIVLADGGTLFLDEIGDLSLAHQAKLLDILEDKVVWPIGAQRPVSVDVRIIAATNRDLEEEIKKGAFRQDLFARLKRRRLHIPPLRERKEDIPLLAGYLLSALRPKYGPGIARLSNKSMDLLNQYDWPENVRELNDAITIAMTNHPGRYNPATLNVLSPDMFELGRAIEKMKSLDEVEKEHIIRVLRQTGGNKEKAARILGIVKETLYNKLEKYGIDESMYKDE
jgi:transcriptional regulator with GAF, ATPase, and Fis domain